MTVVVPSTSDSHGGPVDIQKAWRMLAHGAPRAAQSLMDVAEFGHSEIARVTAASRVLSIVGLGEKSESNVRVQVIPPEFDDDTESERQIPASKVIRERLDAQRAAYEQRAAAELADMAIVDAELLD